MSVLNAPQRIAIISGAGSGIGRACAHRLAQDGMAVACFSRSNSEATASEIAALGGRSLWFHGDVASNEDWSRLVGLVKREFGPVGVLINAAGIAPAGDSMATVSRDMIDRIIQTNLVGTMLGMQAVLPDMIEHQRGNIINFSSLSTVIGFPGLATYTATKGAINALSTQVAKEYAQYNIRVNAVSPGTVATNMSASDENAKVAFAFRGSKGRASPEQPAEIISYLVSGAADYLNGIIIRCGENM